ncbi:MAG: hypothetical protein KME37_07685 [Candidatus Thiodiazotropha sp. (ex Codakia orbicularis)]|nr:hypothetical protein [Candidatus Thiodiazotropha sp. (ex Codakia orbicularis)]
MTELDWGKMSEDEFAKNLFDKLEAEGPVFTLGELEIFEDRLQKNHATRRTALVVLTKSFSEVQEMIENDRDFAVATADVFNCTDPGLYQATHDLLENARIRMAGLLACRDDMEQVIEEAKRANPGGEQ